MMNLYVIGPVTGIPNDNRPEFERVREELLNTDKYERVNIPHYWIHQKNLAWLDCMKISIGAMLQHDGIAMLDGWENSKGAVIEHDLAEALGIPCKPWEEWLK